MELGVSFVLIQHFYQDACKYIIYGRGTFVIFHIMKVFHISKFFSKEKKLQFAVILPPRYLADNILVDVLPGHLCVFH